MDINKKLEHVLNNLDKSTINSGKNIIENFLSSPEGKKLAAKLSNTDKNQLLEKITNMDSAELKNKLKNIDLNKLSQLKADDILKKMR